jgi:hypothetical protein
MRIAGSLQREGISLTLTPENSGNENVESHKDSGIWKVGSTGRWDSQSRSSPGGRDEAVSSCEGCESTGIGPGKVSCAQRRTVVTGVLFSQTTVGWGVFSVDEDEPIGEVFDRGGQFGVCRG